MLTYKNYNILPQDHLYYQAPTRKTRAFCIGTIIEDPISKKSRLSSSKTSFKFKTEFLKLDNNWIPVKGEILVTLYDRGESFKYADRLLVEGDILRPEPPGNPGEFDYKKFLEQDRIFALFRVAKNDLIKKLGTQRLNLIKKHAFWLRHKLKSKIKQHISLPHSTILTGMLLGFREDISLEIKDLFVKTGTMHTSPREYTKNPYHRASCNLTLYKSIS